MVHTENLKMIRSYIYIRDKATLCHVENKGRVAQSVARLTHEPEAQVPYPVRPHTFISSSAASRRAVVSYWQKFVHKVLVNRLGGLSQSRKSMVRLTDCPDMTIAVYHGSKTTRYKTHKRIKKKKILI